MQVGKFFLVGFVIICTVIFLDQYTKWMIVETALRLSGSANLDFLQWFFTEKKLSFFVNEREVFRTAYLTHYLSFVVVWNQGISFGMMDTNSPNMSLVFIALSLCISMFMLIWLALSVKRSVAICLGLIVGGALANVIDRIRFGAVADFIDLHYYQYHWPAFNLADASISIGAMILILITFLGKKDSLPLEI